MWVRKIPWRRNRRLIPVFLGFPGGLDSKKSTCNAGDLDLGLTTHFSNWENPHGQRSLSISMWTGKAMGAKKRTSPNQWRLNSQPTEILFQHAHTHTHITINMLTIIDEMELQKEPPKVNHSLWFTLISKIKNSGSYLWESELCFGKSLESKMKKRSRSSEWLLKTEKPPGDSKPEDICTLLWQECHP